MTYSKSSKREKEGGIQNPAREREKEVFKIQQEMKRERLGRLHGEVMEALEASVVDVRGVFVTDLSG